MALQGRSAAMTLQGQALILTVLVLDWGHTPLAPAACEGYGPFQTHAGAGGPASCVRYCYDMLACAGPRCPASIPGSGAAYRGHAGHRPGRRAWRRTGADAVRGLRCRGS